MPLLLIRNDITKVTADALVNPANPELLEGSGTSRAIYLAAGEEQLAAACRSLGHCEPGNSVITPAFRLQARYIIHTVCPVWEDGTRGEAKLLYRSYQSALELAEEYSLDSIAFPLLSSGNYGFPKEQAMKTALRAVSDFLMEHDLLVYLVLYDRSAVSVSRKLFASVEEYIDDHYVAEKDERYPGRREELRRQGTFQMPQRSQMFRMPMEAPSMAVPSMEAPMPGRSLEELMKHMDETFSEMLLRLIDERGLKDSYVYKRANIDRRHFSKIRNDRDYAPNKKTVFAFIIALELSLDEAEDLLRRAGFSFSNSSKFDVIVCYFIENRKYDIFEINEMLFAYGQPTLGE